MLPDVREGSLSMFTSLESREDSTAPLVGGSKPISSVPIHQQLQYLRSLEGFDSRNKRRSKKSLDVPPPN